MGKVTRARLAAGVLVSAFVAVPARSADPPKNPSSASPKDEARARLSKGLRLYEQGSYEAALSELQRAYELAPSYKLLYNIGQIYRALNDDAGALRAFEQYLQEGGGSVPPKRRSEVEREIQELRQVVATLTITSNVEGAEIAIDDAIVGKTPLSEGIVVNAGRRKITATKAGLASLTTIVNVAGQDKKTIELTFDLSAVATSSASAPPPPRPSPLETEAATHHVPWIGWGITGALAAGAVVTGVLALSSSSDLKKDRSTFGTTRSTLDAAQSKTKTFALVSDVLTAGAVVAGGVSLYFTLKKYPSDEPATEIGIGPANLTVRGRF